MIRSVCRLVAVITAVVVITATPAWGAGAGGAAPTQLTPQQTTQLLTRAGKRAVAIADRTAQADDVRAQGGVTVRPAPTGGTKWSVGYARGSTRILEVDVDLANSKVDAIWTGVKANFPMARGYPGWFGSHVTAPYVWLPLCVVFFFIFFDWRRWRRRAHLDVLAILGFGVSQWFFQRGDIHLSVPLAYVPLLYLLWRMVSVARGVRQDNLIAVVGPRVLVVLLVVLVALRITLNLADHNTHYYIGWGNEGSTVVDVGYAGVVGADRIQHGLEIYTPTAHLDTYGPLDYLAYVPFERLFPYKGAWDSLPAAHAAAICFDLLTLLGLFVLGARLRRGPEGRLLGLTLACAWAACPYTAYVLNANSNDALVSAAIVWTLAFFRAPFVSGLMIGIGTAAKYVPAVLLPAIVRLRSRVGVRNAVLLTAGFLLVVLVSAFAFAPPQGIGLEWRHTVARQSGSYSPFSIWGMWSWIKWLRAPLELILLVAACLVVFQRREETLARAAAVGGALMLGVEITAMHWIYFYIAWFLPLVLVALAVPGEHPSTVVRPRS